MAFHGIDRGGCPEEEGYFPKPARTFWSLGESFSQLGELVVGAVSKTKMQPYLGSLEIWDRYRK